MSDSNGNCSCGCQYSTPPWWVTMGFVPPQNQLGQPLQNYVPAPNNLTPSSPGYVPPISVPPPPPGHAVPGLPGTNPHPGRSPVGNIVGTILDPIGTLVNGIGGLFGKIL